MSDQTEQLEAQNAQREQAKTKMRRATLDDLRGKKPAEREIPVQWSEDESVSFLLRAIGLKEYDALEAKYGPTTAQRAEGATFNVVTFAPALLARVCVEPQLSEAEWIEQRDNECWGRGEFMSLFWAAHQLCNKSLDLSPTEAG